MRSRASGSARAVAGAGGGDGPAPRALGEALGVPPEGARSQAFLADLASLSRPPARIWPSFILENRVVRLALHGPVEELRPAQALVAWLALTALRLLPPVAATALAGVWGDAPYGRWLAVAGLLAAMDTASFRHMHDVSQTEHFVALMKDLDREEDLHELVGFTHRWLRPRVFFSGALVIVLALLSACVLVAPGELRTVPVGSLAMLAVILYEFGEAVVGSVLVTAPFMFKEARYRHRLFWLWPLDTPSLQQMLHAWGRAVLMLGWTTVLYFILAVVLLQPASINLLLAPIAGFTVVAMLVTLGLVVGLRSGVRSVVRLTRDESLQRLRARIDDYQLRVDELTAVEWQQFEGLTAAYQMVRDTPTSPTVEQSIGKALGALAIPAVGFLLAVLAEVYAERLLAQFLP